MIWKTFDRIKLFAPSSVRRILKRGARNFRKFKRYIDQNLKLSHSNFVPFFAQNQVKSKKKGLLSSFVPFFAQNQVISSPKPDAQLAKGGAMPQICSLFCAILQSWRLKGRAIAQCPPLNTPLLAPFNPSLTGQDQKAFKKKRKFST